MSDVLTKKLEEFKNMSLEKYVELKENEIKEQFKVNKDNIIDEDEILIENKIKNIEKLCRADKKIRYGLEDEETNLED